MQQGQVSLELAIILVILLAAVSVLGFVADYTSTSNKTMAVQNQAKVLAHMVAQNLTGLAILSQTNPGTRIEIPTESIRITNPTFLETCTLAITPQTVQITIDWAGDGTVNGNDIAIVQPTELPPGFEITNPPNIPCGLTIIIQKKE